MKKGFNHIHDPLPLLVANFSPRVAIFSLKLLGRILATNALRTANVMMGECHKTQVMIIFAPDEENFKKV